MHFSAHVRLMTPTQKKFRKGASVRKKKTISSKSSQENRGMRSDPADCLIHFVRKTDAKSQIRTPLPLYMASQRRRLRGPTRLELAKKSEALKFEPENEEYSGYFKRMLRPQKCCVEIAVVTHTRRRASSCRQLALVCIRKLEEKSSLYSADVSTVSRGSPCHERKTTCRVRREKERPKPCRIYGCASQERSAQKKT